MAVVSKDEMKRLRVQLKDARVFEHHESESWLKLALMIAVLGCCYAGFAYGGAWLWLALVPIAAVVTTTATLIGHEGSHGSFSARSRSNQVLSYVTLPLLAGISALYWRNKHNVLHHGHPNVVGSDPDLDLWPIAMSRAEHERASPPLRWFQRNLQGPLFWPSTALLATVMRMPSYRYLVVQLGRRNMRSAAIVDAVCLVGHYALWLALPAQLVGFGTAVALYLTIWAVVGVLLAVIFSPAHIGLPLMHGQHNGWRHQLETTRNLRTPAWLSWLYVGLDYQVEHHIFPQIPHQNLRVASAIMRRWCREVGLPYHEIGLWDAIVSVTRFVHDAWRIDASVVDANATDASVVDATEARANVVPERRPMLLSAAPAE